MIDLDKKRTDRLDRARVLAAAARKAQAEYEHAAANLAPALQQTLRTMIKAQQDLATIRTEYARMLRTDPANGYELIGDLERTGADIAALHTRVPGSPKLILDRLYTLPSADAAVNLLHETVQRLIRADLAHEERAAAMAYFQQRYG